MSYSEEDFIAISGLQHLAFCPRQWGLIHLDQEWEENRLTAEGRTLHERVDEGYREFRRGIRQYSGLRVQNRKLGMYGRLDVLEVIETVGPEVNIPLLNLSGRWILHPVEFKRGKPKKHIADKVQLCAQALCLEEMTGSSVLSGSIFYGEIRRREDVELDENLREKTLELIALGHSLMNSRILPAAESLSHCRACSLRDICMPRSAQNYRAVTYYKELMG